MSHDTHNEAPQTEIKSKTAANSSFWFVIILVGLFIAAVNFVSVMSNDDEEGTETHKVEAHKEATATQTMEGETGTGKTVVDTAAADTAHTEAAHEAH